MLNKKTAIHQRAYDLWIHSYKVQKQVKLIYINRIQNSCLNCVWKEITEIFRAAFSHFDQVLNFVKGYWTALYINNISFLKGKNLQSKASVFPTVIHNSKQTFSVKGQEMNMLCFADCDHYSALQLYIMWK